MSDVGNAPGASPGISPSNSAGQVTAIRRLLRRLRGIMAGSASAQERLDRIVRVIAAEMVAEVCSAYVMRAGEVLELFATEGLRPEAVHRTRLRVGEGLVGQIAATARPLKWSGRPVESPARRPRRRGYRRSRCRGRAPSRRGRGPGG